MNIKHLIFLLLFTACTPPQMDPATGATEDSDEATAADEGEATAADATETETGEGTETGGEQLCWEASTGICQFQAAPCPDGWIPACE